MFSLGESILVIDKSREIPDELPVCLLMGALSLEKYHPKWDSFCLKSPYATCTGANNGPYRPACFMDFLLVRSNPANIMAPLTISSSNPNW